MFELTKEEFQDWRSQFATSSWRGARYTPMAFTEYGVLMLSSVLNSERAIAVNIQIIRVYARLRQLLATNTDILASLDAMESKLVDYVRSTKKS